MSNKKLQTPGVTSKARTHLSQPTVCGFALHHKAFLKISL